MYILSCSSICVCQFIASYMHCLHMYVCTLCAVSDIYICKHNKHDSVFVFNACVLLCESIAFVAFYQIPS